MADLAPIVLFTYNRPKHTKATIDALLTNHLAKESELFIYCDGSKENALDSDKIALQQVANIAQSTATSNAFKRVHIISRRHNFGLADSIIDGTTNVVRQYGKVIVLEDDILVSPVFLDFMNAALRIYQANPKVWSISAWSYPIDSSDLGDCYFWRIPHCWGWATWSDRWSHYKRDIAWVRANFNKQDIDFINLDGFGDYWQHFMLNQKGRIKSWAIFNYLIAYKHKSLTLVPSVSYVKQIGFDGSGVHCGNEGDVYNPPLINIKFPINFPSEIAESTIALDRIKAFHKRLKKPLALRAYNKIIKLAKIAMGRK